MEIEIKISGLTKKYKDNTVLDSISLVLGRGAYGLVGPNGAGKTTLMKLLAALIKPDSGTITCNGTDIFKSQENYYRIISYMPQEFGFYPSFTGYEMMDYLRILRKSSENREKLLSVLDDLNLSDEAGKKIGSYSGGMKRRLGIALSLIGNPAFMMFDEPTVGLDPEERFRFKKLIKKLSSEKTILLSTHILSDIEEVCDRTIIIDKGKIISEFSKDEMEEDGRESFEKKYLTLLGNNKNEDGVL